MQILITRTKIHKVIITGIVRTRVSVATLTADWLQCWVTVCRSLATEHVDAGHAPHQFSPSTFLGTLQDNCLLG